LVDKLLNEARLANPATPSDEDGSTEPPRASALGNPPQQPVKQPNLMLPPDELGHLAPDCLISDATKNDWISFGCIEDPAG
jgi:hypothetical protein